MKKLLSLTLALSIILGTIGTTAFAAGTGAQKFKDVPDNAWYTSYVDRLTREGTVTGMTEDIFAPSRTISRAEFVTMVIRSAVDKNLPEVTGQTHWAQRWMDKAVQLGILTAEEFPQSTWNTPIIRQDMAKVITLAMELARKETPATDTDKYISYIGDWNNLCTVCKPYIAQAYAKGILTGISGEFKGTQLTTRGEATCVIVRLIDPEYRVEWYDGVPFCRKLDVTDKGTLKASVAEQFIMKTLESTRYYKENGKYYVSCTYPALPDGFEMAFGTGFEFNNRPLVRYSTAAFRAEQKIPATGNFTREITGMTTLKDLKDISLSIAVKAPNAATGSYIKEECAITVVSVFKSGVLAEFDPTMGYTAGGYKNLDMPYSDIFNW